MIPAAVKAVLDAARADLGMGEYPPNSNRNPIVTWYNEHIARIGAGPWCAMSTTHWMYEGGAAELITGHALVDAFVHDAVNGSKGMSWHWGVAGIRPGDFPVYDWKLPEHPNTRDLSQGDHIGICEWVEAPPIFYAIEGNFGDCVQRLKRDGKYVLGYCRPDYAALAGQPSPVVPPARPARIPGTSLPKLREDGILGPKTMKAAMVLTKTASWREFVTWLQKQLNAHGLRDKNGDRLVTDGKGIGSNENGRYPRTGWTKTLTAAQRWLGTTRDGYLSSPESEWVKRFQRRLNTGKITF